MVSPRRRIKFLPQVSGSGALSSRALSPASYEMRRLVIAIAVSTAVIVYVLFSIRRRLSRLGAPSAAAGGSEVTVSGPGGTLTYGSLRSAMTDALQTVFPPCDETAVPFDTHTNTETILCQARAGKVIELRGIVVWNAGAQPITLSGGGDRTWTLEAFPTQAGIQYPPGKDPLFKSLAGEAIKLLTPNGNRVTGLAWWSYTK